MKRIVLNFIKELICYVITLSILLLIAKRSGWTDSSVIDNVIGLTIAWIIWKLIMIIIDRVKNKKESDS